MHPTIRTALVNLADAALALLDLDAQLDVRREETAEGLKPASFLDPRRRTYKRQEKAVVSPGSANPAPIAGGKIPCSVCARLLDVRGMGSHMRTHREK